jgi:hypothetical protein
MKNKGRERHMSQVRALKRNEVVAIGWNGDAEIIDLLTNTTFTIRGSASTSYDHSDFQTKTPADTAILRRNAGGNWNWTPRPVLMRLKGHLIAGAIHSYPHSIPVASNADNIVNPVLTRANQQDANGNWRIGSHFCFHYIDTITLRAGNRAGDGSWRDRMHQAVLDALRRGTQQFGGGSTPAPAPTPQPAPSTPSTGLRFKVGDVVQFTGGGIFTSSNATTPAHNRNASTCRVTQVFNGRNPYHLISNDRGGVHGWVADASIAGAQQAAPTPPPSQETALNNVRYRVNVKTNLHCRSGAGTTFKSLGTFRANEIVTSTRRHNNGWLFVTNGKLTGWSSGDFLVKV